jgi:hypothetical protein
MGQAYSGSDFLQYIVVRAFAFLAGESRSKVKQSLGFDANVYS